jgi:ribosomal protein L11 methyltransferase
MTTWELIVVPTPKYLGSEILVAELADLGFDSFVDTNEGINAYANNWIEGLDEKLKELATEYANDFSFHWELKELPFQNWNETWESNYAPVTVENYATLYAPFHEQQNSGGLPILIQPQMSFGTGHHPTTWLMIKFLFELERIGECVLDMGSGTGVLAIVAEKLGAEKIVAVDIEQPAVENARQNGQLNRCGKIEFMHGDTPPIMDNKFDLVLANINKNVLKSQFKAYFQAMKNGALLIISGFFEADNLELIRAAEKEGFVKITNLTRENWSAIQFLKPNNR